MKNWMLLIAAILFEVGGITSMKLSDGFTRWVPSVAMFVFYGLAFTSLTMTLKHFDVSFTYAVWSGVGTAVIAVIGVVWFKEPVTALKIVSLLLIIAGVVGLNLGGTSH